MWNTEMVMLLRHMIGDLDSSPQYDDDRLAQLLLVGAQFVQTENVFSAYYDIDVGALTLSPDPTLPETRDNAFINLTVLRSACLLAGSGLGKGNSAGMLVVEGSIRFDNRGAGADKQLQVKTWCQAYADAKWENVSSFNTIPREAIVGPYRVDARKGLGYGPLYTHRDRM